MTVAELVFTLNKLPPQTSVVLPDMVHGVEVRLEKVLGRNVVVLSDFKEDFNGSSIET